jgi:DNA-binding protein HU-beta
MLSKDVIKGVALKSELKQDVIEKVMKAYAEFVGENVMNDSVPLYGLGKFEAKELNARKGRNPKTGEEINLSVRRFPSFRISKTFVVNTKEVL